MSVILKAHLMFWGSSPARVSLTALKKLDGGLPSTGVSPPHSQSNHIQSPHFLPKSRGVSPSFITLEARHRSSTDLLYYCNKYSFSLTVK